jgi:hypothetical protein
MIAYAQLEVLGFLPSLQVREAGLWPLWSVAGEESHSAAGFG